jgi:hypothetical protein
MKRSSTPFTLKGSIPAGGTQAFSTEGGTMTSGTIQGAAQKARMTFTKVNVMD